MVDFIKQSGLCIVAQLLVWRSMTCLLTGGIKQGAIFSPTTLFAIFVNDLALKIEEDNSCICLADTQMISFYWLSLSLTYRIY